MDPIQFILGACFFSQGTPKCTANRLLCKVQPEGKQKYTPNKKEKVERKTNPTSMARGRGGKQNRK
jgi:hypothetical protein